MKQEYEIALSENMKKLYSILSENYDKIEKRIHAKILFGRVGGSGAQGLKSESSDDDLHLFITGGEELRQNAIRESGLPDIQGGNICPYEFEYQGKVFEIDTDFIFWDIVKEKIIQENKVVKQYPSVLCRDESAWNEDKNLSATVRYRNDFGSWLFQLFLLSDSIWLPKDFDDRQLNDLYKQRKTIDIMDAFFLRAYGNYCKFLKDRKEVLVRKYLYTIHHLETIIWIAENRTKPPFLFQKLVELADLDQSVKERIRHYYDLNSRSDVYKTRYKEKSSARIDSYIAERLDYAKELMEKYDKEERFSSVIERSQTKSLIVRP